MSSQLLKKGSHVPKFGNWEGDNVPYTTYFENARIEKAGGMRINPNDPEENPHAFYFGRFENGNINLPVPASLHISDDRIVATEKYHRGQQKSSSHNSIASESGSDRSTSDNTLDEPHHHRRRFDRNNSTIEGHISPSLGSPKSQRSASVPKIWDWNDKDPREGEGFTVIFNKVMEEKQITASKFPPVPVQTTNSHSTNHKTATRSKRCCCLF